MRTWAPSDVTRGQLSLAVCSVICVALHPGFVLKWDEGGFSNYGIHAKTVVPYSLGFLLAAFYSWKAARELGSGVGPVRVVSILLDAYSVLMVLALLSTYWYSRSVALKEAHGVIGIATMLFEPLVALWCFVQLRGSTWDLTLLAIAATGLVLAAIDFLGVLHVLFLAQVLTAGAFGFLLVHAVTRLSRPRDPHPESSPW